MHEWVCGFALAKWKENLQIQLILAHTTRHVNAYVKGRLILTFSTGSYKFILILGIKYLFFPSFIGQQLLQTFLFALMLYLHPYFSRSHIHSHPHLACLLTLNHDNMAPT